MGTPQFPNSGPGPTSLPPGLPTWLQPVVSLTTQVGVPTVFAGVLLWFVLFKVGGVLEHIQKAEDERVQILAAMQDSLIAALDRQNKVFEDAIKDAIQANQRIADEARRDREAFLQKFGARSQ